MSDLFDALEDGGGLLAELGQLARARRPALERAEAEAREQAWGPETDASDLASEFDQLAASDRPGLRFPARYRGGPWQIVVALGLDGEAYLRVERGPGQVSLDWGGRSVEAEPGLRVPLPGLERPPAQLVARSSAERPLLLQAEQVSV
ncbi:MAG: hypothetical protein H6741_34820 [Alphaproteobacteria bacterium]|nr:hypothetical protein [Alphaproteobacteria bacterium]